MIQSPMRAGFVHEATIELAPGADERAVGAAITVALCGHWSHEGECRIPHHTAIDERQEKVLRVRVVFACDPAVQAVIRLRIVAAVATGALTGPEGRSNWQLVAHREDSLRADEATRSGRWLLAAEGE